MGFEFKPSIWFVCRICRQAFRYIYKLKEHKVECHLGECLKTKCLIFEERSLDHEWIPSTEELRSNDGPFSSIAGNSSQRNSYQNPYVLLQQLTSQQQNISPKKLPSASESIPREIEGRRRTGIKRTADKLLVSLSAPVEDEHCTEKKCNIDDGKHAEITTTIAVPQIVFDSEAQKIELNVEELLQLTENTVVSSSTSNLVCESNSVAIVCEDSEEIEIENREFIVANIVQKSDGTGNVHFMSTHVPEIGFLNQRNTFPTLVDDAGSELNSVNEISAIKVQEEINSDEVDVKTESNDAFFDEDSTIPLPFPAEEDHAESLPINVDDDAFSATDRLYDHSSALNNQHSPEQSELTPIPDPRCNSDSTVSCIEIETSLEPNLPSLVLVPLPLEPELLTSFRSRYNTRRKASKVNYSEIQACKGCAKDFYTVEDVEDHEKLCQLLRNKTKENEQAMETVIEEIQVIGSITKKTYANEITSDDANYESPNNSGSDSENEDAECVLDHRLRSQGHSQINQIFPTVTLSPEDLSLPLLDWVTKEKANDPSNVILLGPDQTGETFPVAVNDLHPTKCVLCKLVLTSDTQVKEHVKVCWTFNKAKHVYCVPCKKALCNPANLKRHCKNSHVPLNLITNSLIVETVDGTEAEAPAINSNAVITKTGSQINSDSISELNVSEANLEESGCRHTRRHKSRVDYSETQTCKGCAKDFYTVEDLEDHEQVCSQLRYKNIENKATNNKETEDVEIEVLGSTAENTLANTVADEDDDYECPDSSGSSSDLESAGCVTDPQPSSHYRRRQSGAVPTITLTPEDLSLPLTDWLKKEKVNDPSNVILLDQDPTSETAVVEITFLHPVKCVLCKSELTSDTQVKEHVKVCWHFRKVKHSYCVPCNKSFAQINGLLRHRRLIHKRKKSSSMKFIETKSWYCVPCKKFFSRPDGFKRHCKNFHVPPTLITNSVIGERIIDGREDEVRDTNSKTGLQSKIEIIGLKSKSAQCARQKTVDVDDGEGGNCAIDAGPRSPGHQKIAQNLPTVTLTPEDLSLSLLDWFTKEKVKDGNNIILLDPYPTIEAINDLYPIKCVLCALELNSDTQVKEHVKVCWHFNKFKHVYCIDCKLSFSNRSCFVEHIDTVHKKLCTSNSKIDSSETGKLLFKQNCMPLKNQPLDNSGSETGSNSESDPIYPEPYSNNRSKITQNLPTATLTLTKENSLPLKEWLLLQREKPAHSDGFINVVRIDPDPTLGDLDPPNIAIGKDHPVTCLLCSLLLFSEVQLKNHVENCWFHNKDKHRYCVLCEFRFQSPSLLRIHQQFDHFDYNSETRFCTDAGKAGPVTAQSASEMLQEPAAQPVLEDESDTEVIFMSDEISLVDWLNERIRRASKNIILLDPDPTEAKTPIKISKKFPILCKLCDRKLVSEYTVKVHVQKCWRHNKKAHVFCVPCNMQFGSSIILAIHNRVKHGLGEGPIFPFYCKFCSTGFKDTKALRIHKVSYIESRKAITSGVYNFDQDPSLDDPVVRSGPAGQPVGKSFAENTKSGPDISLAQWLVQQREANSSNCIHLDPDPLSLTPNFEGVSDAHPVTCKLCSRKFTAEALLRHHVQICWLRNKRIHRHCVHCNKTYETPKMLIHHNAIRHPRGPRTTFKCKVCAKEYKSWPSFKGHEKSHVDPDKAKPFKCEICGHSFRWKCLRDTHALSHSSERTFKCPHCPLTFIRKQALVKHLAVHTLGKEDPKDTSKPTGTHLNCKFCDRFFTFKCNLKAHERTHTGDRPFKCQVATCDRAFPSDCALAMHTKIKHSEELGLTQYLCPSCGKTFPLQSHLNYHTRRFHTEAKDKPFKCTHEGCNRTFSMKEQLNQHTLVHTGEKPFQCDQCGRAFAGKQSFKKHQLTHNNKEEGNKILCHLCPKTFSTDRDLQRHLKLGHEKGSKFKCQFCERGFATKSGLTKHEETHEEHTDSDSDSCSD